jgi:SAM-dependent methyltransferase
MTHRSTAATVGLSHHAATDKQLEQEAMRTPEDVRRRYRENHHWRLYPKEWIYRNIPLKGKDVLDFGCGTGEISTQVAFLNANRVYAFDINPKLLELTRRRASLDGVADQVETICGPMDDLDAKPVDVIIAFAVLHHCFPLENSLPQLLHWLKPGGIFVTVEPVIYSRSLEWARNHSGVPKGPLDEGERQLRSEDILYVRSRFAQSRAVHFHLFGRLTRILPKGDRLYRRMDYPALHVPLLRNLAGSVLIVGHKSGGVDTGE